MKKPSMSMLRKVTSSALVLVETLLLTVRSRTSRWSARTSRSPSVTLAPLAGRKRRRSDDVFELSVLSVCPG